MKVFYEDELLRDLNKVIKEQGLNYKVYDEDSVVYVSDWGSSKDFWDFMGIVYDKHPRWKQLLGWSVDEGLHLADLTEAIADHDLVLSTEGGLYFNNDLNSIYLYDDMDDVLSTIKTQVERVKSRLSLEGDLSDSVIINSRNGSYDADWIKAVRFDIVFSDKGTALRALREVILPQEFDIYEEAVRSTKGGFAIRGWMFYEDDDDYDE